MAGTFVRYNRVEFHNCKTLQFSQSVALDDTGVEQIAVDLTARFEGLVHNQGFDAVTPHTSASNGPHQTGLAGAPQFLADAINLLSRAGGDLQINFGDGSASSANIIDIPSKEVTVDEGPYTSEIDITHVCGNRVFRIAFTVTAKYRHKGQGDECAVLTNRWGIREILDENHSLTRVINGQLAYNKTPKNPFLAKYLTIPPLEVGFSRKLIEFDVERSGLKANYSVVDRQTKYAPPWPCATLDGAHAVVSSDGVNVEEEISLSVTANPSASARDLFARCIQIAEMRIDLVGASGSYSNSFITDFRAVETIGTINRVDVLIRKKTTLQTGTALAIGKAVFSRFGRLNLPSPPMDTSPNGYGAVANETYNMHRSVVPTYNGWNSWDGPRTAAAAAVFACFAQAYPFACPPGIGGGDGAISAEKTPKKERTDITETTFTDAVSRTLDNIGEPQIAAQSSSHLSRMYTYYKLSTTYDTVQGVVLAPIASPLADSADTDAALPVKLHRPISRRIIVVDAERLADWPEFPPDTPTVTSGKLKGSMIRSKIEVLPPQSTPMGGGFLFTAKKRLVYHFNRAVTNDQLLEIGRQAYIGPGKNPESVKLSEFNYEDSANSSGGGGGAPRTNSMLSLPR